MVIVHLGKGGYGNVYQYGDKAIKIIKCSADGVNCYNEICLFQNINHPHVMKHDDAYIRHDNVCIVMDKADTDMNRWRKHNTPSDSQILTWCIEILSALAFIHNNSILHCDIKPANLLLFKTKDTDLTGDDTPIGTFNVKLADFSLSRKIGHRNKIPVCTHTYRPPEYWKKDKPKPGFWVDIWALGCTLYYLVRGTYLFPPYQYEDKAKGITRTDYYNRIYDRWTSDHKNLKPSTKLIHRLMMLMLHPNYLARPTAESLLNMINIHNNCITSYVPILGIIKPTLVDTIVDPQFMTLFKKLGLTLNRDIGSISTKIIRYIKILVELDPDLYLSTAIWMASKIISEPYNIDSLGLSKNKILKAERIICSASRFKFCII